MRLEPNDKEFRRRAKKGNVIPVSTSLPADLETPVSVFLKLARDKRHAFLLESVELGDKLGRYSLIGMDPEAIFEYSKASGSILCKGSKRKRKAPFLDLLREVLTQYRMVPSAFFFVPRL